MFRAVKLFLIKIYKSLSLSINYMKFNFACAMEYKAAFITQVMGMALNDAIFLIFWIILYKKIGTDINGYVLNDVMFLWSIVAAGFGLHVIIFGNSNFISKIIYTGELDVYLLQPKPVLINMLCSRMNISGWGDFIYGFFLFVFTQSLDLKTISLFMIFTILIIIVFTSIRVFYHSFTFFLGNVEEFAQTAAELTTAFSIYPGSVFKGPERWLLHSLIPAGLVAYIPVELIKNFNFNKMLILLGADALIMILAIIAFNIGLRYYESGNRIGTRI